MHPDIVRLRIVTEAHSLNIAEALQESLADTMHAIHDPTVTRKDVGYARSQSSIRRAWSTTSRQVSF